MGPIALDGSPRLNRETRASAPRSKKAGSALVPRVAIVRGPPRRACAAKVTLHYGNELIDGLLD